MTGESIRTLADELERVLTERPVDPVAAAAVLERAVAACRSVLGLQDKPTLTGRSPLTTAGRAAALNALRYRAHAPRQQP